MIANAPPHARRAPPAQALVAAVAAGSLAQAAGVTAGDLVCSVNGTPPQDYLEYRFLIAEEQVELVLAGGDGRFRTLTIAKHPDQDLGIEFAQELFDGMRTCHNRCLFCFVAQLPRGLRPSLYVRDDDYRLSFLHGNFLTLTNFTQHDLRRVARLRLSPLYVSVHAVDPALRGRLLGNAGAPPIREQLRALAAEGITVHAQVVLCPGHNDGPVLAETIETLAGLYPAVASLAVVPVGLSAHRAGLPALPPVSSPQARQLCRLAGGYQRRFRAALGSCFLYLADEIYQLAGLPFPSAPSYEGFPQVENGVGLARLFLNEVARLRPFARRWPCWRRLTLVTGAAGAPLVERLADRLQALGVQGRPLVVANTLFGPTVTVSGLLAGADVLRALRGAELAQAVVIPASCLREGRFLDDLELAALPAALGRPVLAAAGPTDLWRQLHPRQGAAHA